MFENKKQKRCKSCKRILVKCHIINNNRYAGIYCSKCKKKIIIAEGEHPTQHRSLYNNKTIGGKPNETN